MTSALMDDIAAAPPEPAPVADLFANGAVIEEDTTPRRTKERAKRGPGRPRKEPQYDPETGEEIVPPKRTYTRRVPDQKLEDNLVEATVKLASDLSAVAPTVAGVLVARAEQTSKGLMALANGRPRVTAALKKVGGAAQLTEIFTTLGLVVVAAMVDFGRIPADSPLLDNMGFTAFLRDDKGKLSRDANGFALKERTTLRDIYTTMHGVPEDVSDSTGLPEPHWSGVSPDTGSGPARFAPGNWIPK